MKLFYILNHIELFFTNMMMAIIKQTRANNLISMQWKVNLKHTVGKNLVWV